jgi:hypothetical protein
MSASDDLDRGRIARSQPIPHDLKKAVDHIRADLGRKISVAELVAHCGVPRKNIAQTFSYVPGRFPARVLAPVALGRRAGRLAEGRQCQLRYRRRGTFWLHPFRKIFAAIQPLLWRNAVCDIAAKPSRPKPTERAYPQGRPGWCRRSIYCRAQVARETLDCRPAVSGFCRRAGLSILRRLCDRRDRHCIMPRAFSFGSGSEVVAKLRVAGSQPALSVTRGTLRCDR